MKQGVKRSVFGVGLILAAFALFVSTILALYRGEPNQVQHHAPGKFVVRTTAAGRFYLWDNFRTVFEGKTVWHEPDFPAELTILVSDEQGHPIDFVPDASLNWQIGNHAQQSIGYIDAPGPGEWRVAIEGPSEHFRVLSFSPNDITNHLLWAFRGFALAAISMILGVPILLWGIWRMSRQVSPTPPQSNAFFLGTVSVP